MHIHDIWRRLTTSRYARALEAELARERARAAEQGIEVAQQGAEIVRQGAEIARLRGENRALLNSILGIAGIPPLPATEADLAAVHAPPIFSVGARPAAAGRHVKVVPEGASGTHGPSTHNPTNAALESSARTTDDGATSPSIFAGHGSAVPLLADVNYPASILGSTPNRSASPDRPFVPQDKLKPVLPEPDAHSRHLAPPHDFTLRTRPRS